SRRRHTRFSRDWSSDVCSSDLDGASLRLELRQLERELAGVYDGSYVTTLEPHPLHRVEFLDPAARFRGNRDLGCLEITVGIGLRFIRTARNNGRQHQGRGKQAGTRLAHHGTSHPTSVRNRARASASSIV